MATLPVNVDLKLSKRGVEMFHERRASAVANLRSLSRS
jgi:hypothetical protein